MGLFDKLFGKKAPAGKSSAQPAKPAQPVGKVSGKSDFDKSRWFTIPYQKEILTRISRIIPSIMVGEDLFGVDEPLSRVDMNDKMGPNSILNGVARVAFNIDKVLSITNMDKINEIAGKISKDDLQFCIDALNEYASMLKPDYAQNILKTIQIFTSKK